MNEDEEWVDVFRFIRAMFPQQRFDEFTPDAWFMVLGGYDAHAVTNAATTCAAKKPFISPAEIIAEIRDTAAARMDDFEYEPGDPDEPAHIYLARRRAQIQAVRDGRRPAALALPPANGRADLSQIGRQIPPEQQPVRRPGPLGVDCPRCHSPAGKGCRTTHRGRHMADVHPARLDASRRT
ncbi:MAG: hypothetical protein HOZ81_50370 [Streptomyces sp.]|nr:hypothetical protein [Streptomyces sp.]NUS24380.1 hypothetical protein [Streptomyces sp.]